MKFDTVVCVGPQHRQIALLSIKSILQFARPRKIYVVTSANSFSYFVERLGKNDQIVMVDEDKLIANVDLKSIRDYFSRRIEDSGRAGWYFQQFLKMSLCFLPEVTDQYLIWDSDTVMLRELTFFCPDGKPLVNPANRYRQPYFDLIEKLLGIKRLVDFSFISEHLMVRKNYMRQLIDLTHPPGTKGYWPFSILDLVEDDQLSDTGFSEFETYGNFVHMHYPDSYGIRELSSLRSGAKKTGPLPGLRDLYCLSRRYDYVSFEVWTKPSSWVYKRSKMEASVHNAIASVAGLFSKRITERRKKIKGIFN